MVHLATLLLVGLLRLVLGQGGDGDWEHDHRRQLANISTSSLRSSLVTSAPSSSLTTSTFIPASTALAAARHNTSALAYAQALLNSSTSALTCSGPGGGCEDFNLTLSACTADDCACADPATLSAMVCAQCIATQSSIEIYNTYLNSCAKEGVAAPTDTYHVEVQDSSYSSSSVAMVTSSPSTTTSTATVTSAPSTPVPVGSNGNGPPSSSPGVELLVGSPTATTSSTECQDSSASSNTGATGATSDAGGASTTLLGLVDLQGDSSSSDTGVPMTSLDLSTTLPPNPSLSSIPSANSSLSLGGIVGISDLQNIPTEAGGSVNISALSASVAFFSGAIDPSCTQQCLVWQNLSTVGCTFQSHIPLTDTSRQICQDDKCVCTANGISSAASCSSCVGSATHGSSYQTQQAAYGQYMANCSIEVGVVVSAINLMSRSRVDSMSRRLHQGAKAKASGPSHSSA